MADYLSDLAAGLGEAAGFLRPRQASLFEPTDPDKGPVSAGDPASPEQDIFRESNRSELPRPREATDFVPDREQRSGRDNIQQRNSDDRWDRARNVNDVVRSAAIDSDEHKSRPQADAVDRVAVKSAEAMSPFEDIVEKPKARARPQQPAEDAGRHSDQFPRPAADTPNALSPRPETAAPSPDVRSSAAGVFHPPPVRESPVRPRITAQDAAERRQREPVEPTIHITIGRVEVRATQEAAPRGRKKEEPSPVMTLDEYLQKRAR